MSQGGSRIHRETAEDSVLMFVSLFGQGILIGPGWAIEEANGMTDVELASHERLLAMSHPHGGRALGEASLHFSDTAPSVPHGTWEVRRDSESAEVLETNGAPGDLAEAGFAAMAQTLVLFGGDPDTPLASAGYDTGEGTLAQMGAMAAPEQRRRGHGLAAVLLAMRQAGGEGLIPQWRERTDNLPSRQTAVRAGFQPAGTQTSVVLGSS